MNRGIGDVRREEKASSSHLGKRDSDGIRGWKKDCRAAPSVCLTCVFLPDLDCFASVVHICSFFLLEGPFHSPTSVIFLTNPWSYKAQFRNQLWDLPPFLPILVLESYHVTLSLFAYESLTIRQGSQTFSVKDQVAKIF